MQWAFFMWRLSDKGQAPLFVIEGCCIFTHFFRAVLRLESHRRCGNMVKNKPLTRGKLVKMSETV
ncbi:hypothetical protein C5B77_11285 [Aeromonas salmonicida]|nr:hypothetical protein C5B77_11285 [Aeromonas salmonicida]